MNKHGKLLLCGDFNFHLEDAANTDSNKFLELLSCQGYAPVLDAHLTQTHREGGVLDAFITSNNVSDRVHLLSINVLPETGTASNHNLVRACVEFDVMDTPSSTQQMMIYRRLWKMGLEKMKDDLNNAIILNKFCECFNVNDCVEDYNTILSSILDEHAPKIIKFKMSKQKRTCWWDGTCQEIRRRRRRAERAFRKTGSSAARKVFQEACAEAKGVYISQREAYYASKLQRYKGDTRNTYRVVNQLLDRQLNGKDQPFCDLDDYTVACNFAEFFGNKVRNISNSIAATSSTDMGDNTVKQYLHLHCVKEVGLSNMRSFQPLTVSDLKDVMDEMNSKTCDLDPFPTHLVLRCLDVL